MSDIYTPPPRTAYYLAQAFYMPSDKGDRWAIAFSGRSSVLVASALSVVVTLSFAALWKIICFLSLMFQGNESRRRFVGMIMLWNSGDAIAAFLRLVTYTVRCYPRTITKPKTKGPATPNGAPQELNTRESKTTSGASQNTHQKEKHPKQRGDFLYGLSLCLVCFAVWGGSVAMSTVVSWLVSIGHVAPVNPSVLFYPDIPGQVAVQQLKDFGLRAPGMLRSLGSVEAAQVTLRNRVSIESWDTGLIPNGTDLKHELKYDYTLTGVDLGLQGGDGLSLGVEGHCRTEYDWYRPEFSNNASEVYHLWNDKNQPWPVELSEDAITRAPTAAFQIPKEDVGNGQPGISNYSFAIIVHSARRTSVTEGSDPWYTTELRDQPADASKYYAKFWMKRARPILSCWEQMQWSHKGTALNSIEDLRDQPGRTIPDILVKVLEVTFLSGPMLVRLGNGSGDSALRSRTTSPNGVIDASMSSIKSDIERLVLASFVATRNIFIDTTMFGGSETTNGYPNVFQGGNGQAEKGSGHFVVSSPDIQTFSLTGIICLVSILVLLTAIWLLLELLLLVLKGRHHPVWCKYHVLDAVQLFRCLYERNDPPHEFSRTNRPTSENLPKIRAYGGWRCTDGVPQQQIFHEGEDTASNIEDDFCLLTPCKETSCMGHILKDLAKEVNPTKPKLDAAMPKGDYEKGAAQDTINPGNISNRHT
ncbi:hypothetical protein B0T13DRAFT_280351 [Neurospora crassa]|nr:hypothetical protein B0T13DRAFT_280351 [Neurospora crassa]